MHISTISIHTVLYMWFWVRFENVLLEKCTCKRILAVIQNSLYSSLSFGMYLQNNENLHGFKYNEVHVLEEEQTV